MGFLTGKASKSTSQSGNKAYDYLKGALGGSVGMAGEGLNLMRAFLGGDTSGFDAYKRGTGFDFAAEQGSRGITGNAAARGLLRSGSTGQALVDYGNNLQQTYADKYLQHLLGLSGGGLQAANTIAGAGQYSTGQQTGGKGGLLGPLLSLGAAASDIRLKENIVKVGEIPEVPGLGWYEFNYIGDETRYAGVMAQEVEKHAPEALGPEVDGYMTVYYHKLPRQMEIVDGV